MQEQESIWTPEITRSIKISYLCSPLYTSFISSLPTAPSIFLINMMKGSVATSAELSILQLENLQKDELTFSWSWYRSSARGTWAYVKTLSCHCSLIRPTTPASSQRWYRSLSGKQFPKRRGVNIFTIKRQIESHKNIKLS